MEEDSSCCNLLKNNTITRISVSEVSAKPKTHTFLDVASCSDLVWAQKPLGFGSENLFIWLKIPVLVATNTAGDGLISC